MVLAGYGLTPDAYRARWGLPSEPWTFVVDGSGEQVEVRAVVDPGDPAGDNPEAARATLRAFLPLATGVPSQDTRKRICRNTRKRALCEYPAPFQKRFPLRPARAFRSQFC